MNHKKTARKTGFKKKLPVFMLLLLLTAALWEMGLLSQPPAIVPEEEKR